jgi:hypothetical protein
LQGSTTISALEQLTVTPGEAPEKMTFSQQQLDALGGCLLDFRELALRVARSNREGVAVDRMLDVDSAAFERALEEPDLECQAEMRLYCLCSARIETR